MFRVMEESRNQHAMLLYKNEPSRNQAAAKCLNQGLKEGQLCIYASVNAHMGPHLAEISSLIEGYEENIEDRNLLVVGLKPFYDSALKGDLTPFNEFNTQIQEELRKRGGKGKSKDVLIIADCADNLFTSQRFNECETVENWWNDVYNKWRKEQQQQQQEEKYNHFTVICPYSSSLLVKNPFSHHKHQISHNHSIAIDTEGHVVSGYANELIDSRLVVSQAGSSTRIIIAEPDSDLRSLYNIWRRSIGFKDMVIVDSGRKCIEELVRHDVETKESTSFRQDLIVILDTHLKDIRSVEVAKEIINKNPQQKIIFTSTLPTDVVRQETILAGLDNCNILTKPFQLSKLSSLLLHTDGL
jgi:CheY-like chemotaxis protein